jgi:hypothetical protein
MIDTTVINEYIKERKDIDTEYKTKLNALDKKITDEIRSLFDKYSKVKIGTIIHNSSTTTTYYNEVKHRDNYYKVSDIKVMTNGCVEVYGYKRKINKTDWYVNDNYLYATDVYTDFKVSDKFDIVDESNM